MIEATCDCGAVRLHVTIAPAELYACPCDWCRKLGALWAYYPTDQVGMAFEPGATDIYQRGPRRLEFHSCRVCGLTTHWVHADKSKTRMGVNARLMPRDVQDATRRRPL